MNNMSMKNKFALVCSILALAVIVQAVVIYSGSSSIISESKQIAGNEIPILNKAHQLKLSIVQVQQWLTDISATRGRDGLNDGFDEAEANAQLFKQLLTELKELDVQNRALYEQMLPAFESYHEVGKKMAQSYIDEGPAGGNGSSSTR